MIVALIMMGCRLMTENYLNPHMLSCMYLWKQFSAVNPYNQISSSLHTPRCRFMDFPAKENKARGKLHTRRALFSFRTNYLNLLGVVLFSLFKIYKGNFNLRSVIKNEKIRKSNKNN